MSLEQSFSKKLTLGPGGSQDRAKSPSSTESSPKSSPSKSATGRLSLKGLRSTSIVGGVSGGVKRSRSPLRRQQTLGVQESNSSVKKDKRQQQGGGGGSLGTDLGEFIPGTSGLPGVDHSPFDPNSSSSTGKSKILSNWKSACGRTKDKTKDFIRRWKTLPENHPDFDQIHTSSSSPQGGSATNITCASASSLVSQQHQHGSGSEWGTNSGNATSAGMAFSSSLVSTASGGSSSGLGGKLKNLGKKQSESSGGDRGDVSFGTAASGSSGGVSSGTAVNSGSAILFGGARGGGGGSGPSVNGPLSKNQEDGTHNSMQVDGDRGGSKSTGWSVHVWGKLMRMAFLNSVRELYTCN